MSREIRILAVATVTIIAARAALLALDAAVNGWRRRKLYQP